MSANIEVLMGEVAKNPQTQEKDVELLLQNFIKALIEEQKLIKDPSPESEDL